MRQESVHRTHNTKAATTGRTPESPPECELCGWGVTPELCWTDRGDRVQVLCINPWLCWERQQDLEEILRR